MGIDFAYQGGLIIEAAIVHPILDGCIAPQTKSTIRTFYEDISSSEYLLQCTLMGIFFKQVVKVYIVNQYQVGNIPIAPATIEIEKRSYWSCDSISKGSFEDRHIRDIVWHVYSFL
jgi:hypothetical protein